MKLRQRETPTLAADPVVAQLKERLTSLHDHCLTDLAGGLRAINDADLTRAVEPVTAPLAGTNLGTLGELFNRMLHTAQGGLQSYNAMRSRLNTRVGGMVSEIG